MPLQPHTSVTNLMQAAWHPSGLGLTRQMAGLRRESSAVGRLPSDDGIANTWRISSSDKGVHDADHLDAAHADRPAV